MQLRPGALVGPVVVVVVSKPSVTPTGFQASNAISVDNWGIINPTALTFRLVAAAAVAAAQLGQLLGTEFQRQVAWPLLTSLWM